MGALDQTLQMKREGMSEAEIISRLKSQGISPMEISDAINQSKIKEAVGNNSPPEGMLPSIMQQEEEQAPQTEEEYQNYYNPQAQQYAQGYDPNFNQGYGAQPPMQSYPMETQNEYYQEGYTQDEYSPYSSPSDTMIEIAEQVFSEKIKRFEKQMRELIEFKTIYASKIDDMNERLKRMEKYFDKMQMTIIEKVGTYGKELTTLQKEMEMIENSFSKIHKN